MVFGFVNLWFAMPGFPWVLRLLVYLLLLCFVFGLFMSLWNIVCDFMFVLVLVFWFSFGFDCFGFGFLFRVFSGVLVCCLGGLMVGGLLYVCGYFCFGCDWFVVGTLWYFVGFVVYLVCV